MASGYMITKTCIKLTEELREILADTLNIGTERVGMCVPGDNSHFLVCIYLYDIKKNTAILSQDMVSVGTSELRYPSSFYDLYYMIVPYSEGNSQYRLEEEIKLLDVILQYLGDRHFLNINKEVQLELSNLDFDSKTKIWNSLNQPLRNAVYCKAGPVEIESTRKKKIARVTDIQMNFKEK